MPTTNWGAQLDRSDPRAEAQNEARTDALAYPLPSTEAETWRYSPIGDLVLSDFAPVAAVAPSDAVLTHDAVAAVLASVPERSGLAITHNGVVVVSEGIVATSAPDPAEMPEAGSDLFTLINFGYVIDPLHVTVGAGTDVHAPVVILHYVDEPAAAVSSQLTIEVADDAALGVVEIVIVAPQCRALVVPRTQIRVGQAARVGYQYISDAGPDTWIIGTHQSYVDQQASYDGHFAAFGGRYCRQAISCDLIGRGSTGNLSAVSFGQAEEVVDYRTFQHHVAPDATSNLLFKGVVDEKARSIYTGLIRVGPDASGTNAFQTNRNIKLSDDAWAESVPNLEIETNDVRCSHASTVGPIDEGQRFYLESHGVPTAEAERLIVAGFFAEVIDASPVPELAASIRQRVAERLKET